MLLDDRNALWNTHISYIAYIYIYSLFGDASTSKLDMLPSWVPTVREWTMHPEVSSLIFYWRVQLVK